MELLRKFSPELFQLAAGQIGFNAESPAELKRFMRQGLISGIMKFLPDNDDPAEQSFQSAWYPVSCQVLSIHLGQLMSLGIKELLDQNDHQGAFALLVKVVDIDSCQMALPTQLLDFYRQCVAAGVNLSQTLLDRVVNDWLRRATKLRIEHADSEEMHTASESDVESVREKWQEIVG